MRYKSKLPSVSLETNRVYESTVSNSVDFSDVQLPTGHYNFTNNCDVFELSDYVADKLALIGREHDSGEIGIERFRLDLFNQIHNDTHIGLLLTCVNKKRKEDCFPYGMWGTSFQLGTRYIVL